MQEQIKARTRRIGVEVISLVSDFSQKPIAWIISKQLLRSATSIGANYRAACRAKSTADFVYKLKVVEEETDETLYWLEILQEARLVENDKLKKLILECNEILAIVVASIKTCRGRYPQPNSKVLNSRS